MVPETEKSDVNWLGPVLLELYGIQDASILALDGYENRNYRVTHNDRKYVLKLYEHSKERLEVLKAETSALRTLQGLEAVEVPQPVKGLLGSEIIEITADGKPSIVRLLTFLEGDRLGDAEFTPEMLWSFGRALAHIDQGLTGFENAAISARRSVWDLKQFELSCQNLPLIENSRDRSIVEYLFMMARQFVVPELNRLRMSVIHGDPNELNVIVAGGKVKGLIDFGDLFHSPLICDLAIAAAYALLFVDDPVSDVVPLVQGFNEVLPLREEEISVLYHLIAIRMCICVCNSAWAKLEMPENEYALVSEKAAWEFLRSWVRLSPLKIEDEFRKAVGFESKLKDTIEEDLARRRKNTSRTLSLQFEKPLRMSSAAFQYMFDPDGKTYLDCYNNIPHVGHCHPRIVSALAGSSAKLNTNTRYLSESFNEYSERLLAEFPDRLDKVFFVNSGSAATDLAIRLALAHTGNEPIVALEHGYHGNTQAGINVSHYKYSGRGGSGKADYVVEAAIPDTYRGRYKSDDGSAGLAYARDLKQEILEMGVFPAAFIAEPIVGCGGQVPLAKGYLAEIYPFIRDRGGLCISDEVQTGFGRLGSSFWGFEMHGVDPDIVILGKPMGNGHPMAAVVTTSEVAASFETGMEFFSSFGGNTVSCDVGIAVLDVIKDEGLQKNALDVGGYLLNRLNELVKEINVCGDARGAGLFLGLDLVKEKLSREPDPDLAGRIQNRLKERGILIGTDGPRNNVLKIKPPLCFTRDNADELVDALEDLLRED